MHPARTSNSPEEFYPIQKEMQRSRQNSEGYHSSSNLVADDLDVLVTNSERLYSTVQPLIEKDEYSISGPPPIIHPTSGLEYQQGLHIPHKSPPDCYITPVHAVEVAEYKHKRNHDSTSSTSPFLPRLRNKSRTGYCVGLMVVVFSVIILVVGMVGVVVLYFKYSDLQYQMAEMMKKNDDPSEVCMPCGDLKVGIFEEDNAQLQFLIRKEVSGVGVCCAKTPDQTKIMFDLVSI